MKIPPKFIGRPVQISWVDPRELRVISHFPEDHRDLPHGRAGLARWEEYGVIEKIEEGVVYLRQSIGTDPPGESNRQHDLQYSLVPEDLIFRVALLVVEEDVLVIAEE